jgi:hypothetical protein
MIKLILLMILFMVPLTGDAQKNALIESEIRRLEQMAVDAVLASDSNALKKIWAPEFMVTTPRNEIAKDRAAVFMNQKKGFINYSSFERIIEEIRIHKNVVVTMGYEVFVPKTDLPEGKAGQSVKRRFTNVWMKKKGVWQQVARHASIICT